MLRFEEPDLTPNLTVEYSRGFMIMPFWLYGGAQCLISHRTTGFLPISLYTAYYDNVVNKNLKRKKL